ncbi:MAG TPA: tetratricopeptide repeat protein [bacterium (Candidatus Stahlbacteria)]|nr:tetratricopeptide repeat protein [Candidatus Stahlbacteria bacterium]
MITALLIAINLNPPDVVTLVTRGLDHAYVEEFDRAEVYFDSVIKSHPDNPAGYFFKSALIELYIMDSYDFEREDEFFALIDTTIKKAKAILKRERNGWAQFYYAAALVYRAVYEGFQRNYWATFRHGVKGGAEMMKVIEIDSTVYDAYLGIGVYEYFWATASRYIPILKLFGRWEDGVKKIEIARDSGLYSSVTAINALSWIMTVESKPEIAIALAETLLVRYPKSRTFRWTLARAYLAGERIDDALSLYQELLDYYQNDKNVTNIAQVNLDIARCLITGGRGEEALKHIGVVLKTPVINRTIQELIDEAMDLERKIKK